MNRLLTIALLSVSLLFIGCNHGPEANESAMERPNIIMFLVDDMGWQDTSVPFHTEMTPFNKRYRTPHMQKLASKSTLFTNAYAASPVCTPTRTSIMTGQNPARSRITNWTIQGNVGKKHSLLTAPDWNYNGLTAVSSTPNAIYTPTLTHILQSRGYHTIHVGKAHWGSVDSDGQDPLNLGFDVNISGHASGGPSSYYGEWKFMKKHGKPTRWDVPGLEKYHGKKINLTEALTIEACEAIDSAVKSNKPFYLNMAHYTVHAPIMADHKYVQNYPDLDPREAAYASMVEAMDVSLGQIMAKLKQLGQAENTIIIFFSDNGGLSAHARGGQKHTHNAPLKSGKGSSYEGGTRVPLMIHWPGHTRKAYRSDTPVISCDLFPTILEMANVQDAQRYTHSIDGVSITSLVKGHDPERPLARPLVWHYPHQWGAPGPGIWPYSAIRVGDWKLIYFHAGKRFELYNLKDDIGETDDLAESEPERVRLLAELLGKYLRSVDAQMPTFTADKSRVPYPDEALKSE